MNARNLARLPFISLSAAPMLLVNACAPMAPLQSPRVNSYLSVSSRLAYVKTDYRTKQESRESAIEEVDESPCRGIVVGDALPGLTFGIARRVEFSVRFYPFVWTAYAVGGSAKINLFDLGAPRLFRNAAVALYGQHIYYGGERDRNVTTTGGVIVGTHKPLGSGELELVAMVTGVRNIWSSGYDMPPGVYTFDRWGADISAGAVCMPDRWRRLEFCAGLTYRYTYSNHFEHAPSRLVGDPEYTAALVRVFDYPLAAQLGLTFNIARAKPRVKNGR